jgi:hypothetical protein
LASCEFLRVPDLNTLLHSTMCYKLLEDIGGLELNQTLAELQIELLEGKIQIFGYLMMNLEAILQSVYSYETSSSVKIMLANQLKIKLKVDFCACRSGIRLSSTLDTVMADFF